MNNHFGFSLASVVIDLLAIFYLIIVAEYIWDPCCHLTTETDSWFIIIRNVHIQKQNVSDILAELCNFNRKKYYLFKLPSAGTTCTVLSPLCHIFYFITLATLTTLPCQKHRPVLVVGRTSKNFDRISRRNYYPNK